MTAYEDEVYLTKGSKYRIQSLGSREQVIVTHGIFRGQTALGDGTAIAVEMDESHRDLAGKVRLIPSHMILAIDMLQMADERGEPEDADLSKSYL